jgi:hypothetical protein
MFYNARYYDPVVGRFTQADTVLDGTNRYTYVRNNPTRFTDPTGRSAEEARRARCGFHGTRCGNGAMGRAQTMALNAGASTGIPVVDGVIDALGDSLPGSLGEVADGFKALGECMFDYGLTGCGLMMNVQRAQGCVELAEASGWGYAIGYCGTQVAGDVVGAVGGVTGVRSVLSNTRRLGLRGDPFDVRHLCSFSAETEVVMADGTTKPISEVEVGDWVLAEDPETGQRGARRVLNLFVHDDTLVDLGIDGGVVTTTEDHPFWNQTDGVFQRADGLDAGDLVLTADGGLVPVDGLVAGSDRAGTAYNLHIEEIHTYFVVVGDEEALVHNQCPSARNYRDLFRKQNPSMPAGYEVHHALPQKYDSIMQQAGINIHENQFLRGVDATIHRTQITPAWTRWERSLGRTPTAQEITNFSYTIDEQFGQYFIFGSP